MSTSRLWPFVGVAALSGAAGFGTAASLGLADARAMRSDALERQEARIEQALRKLEACQPTSEAMLARATVAVDTSGLREEIRQLLKEELRSAVAPASPAMEPPRAAERPAEPDAQSAAAFSQGRRLVEDAVALARWNETQRQELRALFPLLTQEQREEVIRTLLVSINSGKVKVELVGAPF